MAAAMIAVGLSPGPASGEWFLGSGVETSGGYESNRWVEPDGGRGSPYLELRPSVELTWIGLQAESSLQASCGRIEFLEDDADARQDASALLRWHRFGGLTGHTLELGAGLYRDGALPDHDHDYVQAGAHVLHALRQLPMDLGLRITGRLSTWSAGVAPAEDRTERYVEARGRLSWRPERHLVAWADAWLEGQASDDPAEEYRGSGAALGIESQPKPRFRWGAWLGIGNRSYEQAAAEGDRDDTRWFGGIRASFRIHPNLEIFVGADGDFTESTAAGLDIRSWRAGTGLQFAFERGGDAE